ncbi:MAG: histidine kinase, partial [Sphingomonas sp.]
MRTPSSLGAKLLLIMTVVGVIAAIAITLLLAGVITPSFTRLEGKAVAAHVERTRAAVSDYAASVESAARDYGDWNDGNAYPADSDTWLARENLDGIAYVTSQGRTVAARWRDPTRHADRADRRTPLP